ncbi:proteasome maturation ans ribosome synthesis protein [Niveomyces insectorum RCEF 264]|uniref:Proteasome maturation ans ribosome synthesis protein n=1 Tax=Niveomyces insectorum RCEF 264 TaxID=1081102 RepID=A0A167S289_9HYPO|nr:proteasome maturation ans ribosome synthesis protein [Niveomyces insectorum RCEF 264]
MATSSGTAPDSVPDQPTTESTPASTEPPPTEISASNTPPSTSSSSAAVPANDAPVASGDSSKPIHTLILDTGPLIKNDPPLSTLLAQAEVLVTTPEVLAEVRDPTTRARVDTMLRPFLTVRAPKPASVQFVREFARKTGDLGVLSRQDINVLALTYEVECERNGGDWRLRSTPTQTRLNGKSPAALAAEAEAEAEAVGADAKPNTGTAAAESASNTDGIPQAEQQQSRSATDESVPDQASSLEAGVADLSLDTAAVVAEDEAGAGAEAEAEAEDDDEGGEWITPSNLKKHQARDRGDDAPTKPIQARLQAALLTSDFAMQNVALRVNLNLLSPTATTGHQPLARITSVKTWVLRCHGCFAVTRQLEKQFCPACGQATLTRTSCSTDAKTGTLRLHLKRNYQYNKRGNVYSVPKPVHGSASGKRPADRKANSGGQQGWGRSLILSEDQPEYTKLAEVQQRAATRMRDAMDEDYLPGLLTGVRSGAHNRIRVGAGGGEDEVLGSREKKRDLDEIALAFYVEIRKYLCFIWTKLKPLVVKKTFPIHKIKLL